MSRLCDMMEYNIWRSMRQRCNNIRCAAYYRYGGRGIKVCNEWDNSFERFLNDMGLSPSKNHSIERIDNNKGYYKDNCKWATRSEQARNKGCNIWAEYNGENRLLVEWASIYKVSYKLVHKRYKIKGWSIEDSLKPPRLNNTPFEYNGESMSLLDWSKRVNIKCSVLIKRLKRGWTLEKALTTISARDKDKLRTERTYRRWRQKNKFKIKEEIIYEL